MCTAIHVFVIALMVQSGLAITCYNCDTDNMEGCANMTDKNLIAEECDDQMQKKLQEKFDEDPRNFLLQMSDVRFRRMEVSDKVEMVCQKIVGIDADQKRSVIRRCQLATVECKYTEEDQKKLPQFKDVQIEFCGICNDTACNSSPSDRVFGVLVGVAVVTVTVFRHLRL